MPIQFITPSIISSVANTQVTGTIISSQLAANTVTGDKIGQNAISSNNISTGATVRSNSSATAYANSVASNVYTNVHSNLTLPDKSMIVAQFDLTTSGGNTPSEATYGMYISTSSTSSGRLAYQDGVGVYPKAGVAGVGGNLTHFNLSGTSQSIWLAIYPYAGGSYNTPNANVTYRIVSFA